MENYRTQTAYLLIATCFTCVSSAIHTRLLQFLPFSCSSWEENLSPNIRNRVGLICSLGCYFLYVIHYSFIVTTVFSLFETSNNWTISKIGLSGYVSGGFEAASHTKGTKVQRITSVCMVLFHSLSPDDSFVIGFGVTHGTGSLNQGTTGTGFIEKGLYSSRTGFLIAKKHVLANDIPLIIWGWDNRQ